MIKKLKKQILERGLWQKLVKKIPTFGELKSLPTTHFLNISSPGTLYKRPAFILNIVFFLLKVSGFEASKTILSGAMNLKYQHAGTPKRPTPKLTYSLKNK